MNIHETTISKKQFFTRLDEQELHRIILDAVVKEAKLLHKNVDAVKIYISTNSSSTRAAIPYAEVTIDVKLNTEAEVVT
jgi:hypothetical protein